MIAHHLMRATSSSFRLRGNRFLLLHQRGFTAGPCHHGPRNVAVGLASDHTISLFTFPPTPFDAVLFAAKSRGVRTCVHAQAKPVRVMSRGTSLASVKRCGGSIVSVALSLGLRRNFGRGFLLMAGRRDVIIRSVISWPPLAALATFRIAAERVFGLSSPTPFRLL